MVHVFHPPMVPGQIQVSLRGQGMGQGPMGVLFFQPLQFTPTQKDFSPRPRQILGGPVHFSAAQA